MSIPKRCHQCNIENPDAQAFCGACGSPLALNDYVSGRVKAEVSLAVQNRDVLETDSAVRIFERAFGWIERIFKYGLVLVGICLSIITFVGVLKYRDLTETINGAKKAVTDTADSARRQMANDTSSFTKDLDTSREELRDASRLKPQMEKMQGQLAKANADIQVQQKLLSSSETFAKEIFSSHVFQSFARGKVPSDHFAVVQDKKNHTSKIYLLAPSSPIKATLQWQWGALSQYPDRLSVRHNLIIVEWNQEISDLPEDTIVMSYFPDPSDKTIYRSLSVRNGKVFADGEAIDP